MPHQCVRCNKLYEDGAKEILSGCMCGAKLFFFIKKSQLDESRKLVQDLTEGDKKQIEEDVLDLVGSDQKNNPVILDFESIRILKPGQYELDLVNLFKKESLIYKLEEGKYVIDVVKTFEDGLKK